MATDAEEPAYAFSFAVNDDWAAYLTQQLIAFNQPHASPLW
jgi:ribosomal protein S18 acetylase RimI-like enzyme